MKRAFRFRLARVARVRELLEEAARAELSSALALVHAAEDRVAGLRDDLHRGRAALGQLQTQGRLDASAHLAHHEALGRILEASVEADQERARLDAVAAERRAEWQARRSDKEALARLAERHRERHRDELARAELAELDEIAIQRAHAISSSSNHGGASDKASSPLPHP